MRWTLPSLLCALALASCAAPRPQPNAVRTRDLASVHLDRALALSSFNAYRASLGLAPVAYDPALDAMAQRQAEAMVAANALSHDLGGGFYARVTSSGVKFTEAGENLGAGYDSTSAAFVGWRNSPEHDANLTRKNINRFGIALAKDAHTEYGAYWAMEVANEP